MTRSEDKPVKTTDEPWMSDDLINESVRRVRPAVFTTVRRTWSIKIAIGAIAAFALAGAVTGGAVAATSAPDPAVAAARAAVQSSGQFQVREQDGTVIGHPFLRSSVGTFTINLGPRPAGATHIVEADSCIDPGKYVGFLNSKQYEVLPDCNPDGTEGTMFQPTGDGDQIVTIQISQNARFTIWLVWVKIPKFQNSPAQKAELADGTITRDEDVAAFSRYQGCLGALGHPSDISPTAIVPSYIQNDDAAENDGSNTRCYTTEYRDVDMKWEQEAEQTNVATPSIDACLVLHEVTPATTPEARFAQIQDLDLNLGNCTWTQ
jgi:hypothetical protein